MLNRLLIATVAFSLSVHAARAQEWPEFQVTRVSHPPIINGALSDEAWNGVPLALGGWTSYDPIYGERMAQRTEVRVVHDDRNLYFAFHCYDKEPDKIRTTISRRDSIFADDWVGLSLDSANTGQTSYHMIVNPSGIQMDALNTTSSNERWEADWVWYSAGKITSDGYTVEIRLPLQSIRFKGGAATKMGILFWRRVSRLGVSSSWPDIPPGQWVFNRHTRLVFDDLRPPRLVEFLPSVTYAVNQRRANTGRWNDATRDAELGMSAKYGITSTIILDATIHPDFSQVESDAFQVEVNQRFPIFFPEKRPFFMEGMGLFNVAGAGNGDGNMTTAVHTRRIVEPTTGAKLTGTAGRFTFGVLSAADESGDNVAAEPEAGGAHKFFSVARAVYALGESNYVGALVADVEYAGRQNRVIGSDLSLRLTSRQQLSATFLASHTAATAQSRAVGVAGQAYYSYATRRVSIMGQIEHYSRQFEMDTAFYNRTGFTSGWAFGLINYYPSSKEHFWIKRVAPFCWTKLGRDEVQDGNERYVICGIRANFTRQGFIRIDYGLGREPWARHRFTFRELRAFGNVQIRPWLYVGGQTNSGLGIFYDRVDPFQGRSASRRLTLGFQPSSRVNAELRYDYVSFDRASNAERVFTVHIANLRSTYQFTKHFFLRGIVQFDGARHRLLTDSVASYEFVPGTVFHTGYGSLIEERDLIDGGLVSGIGDYVAVSRGFFFKTSYSHRF